MNLSRRSLMFILIGAAAGGVYVELKHHERKGAALRASAAAAASSAETGAAASAAAGPSGPEPAPVSAQQAKLTQDHLRAAIKPGLSDANSPWALAHGLIAFGRDFSLPDGKQAVEAIGALLAPAPSPGEAVLGADRQAQWVFPKGTEGSPGEPHPHLVLDLLLQAGVPESQALTTSTGAQVSLGALVESALTRAAAPTTAPGWVDSPWVIGLTLRAAGPRSDTLRQQYQTGALTELERSTQVIADYSGAPEVAFKPGTPLFNAKRDKSGIYAHHCGGLHFMQAVLALYQPAPAEHPRLTRQLEVLVKRIQFERATYAALERGLAAAPEPRLLVLVQQLKFFGHSAETLGAARELGLYDPKAEPGAGFEAELVRLAGDLVRVFSALESTGAYRELAAIRTRRPQTYLDLVGDGSHAVRGLQRALPALTP